MSPLNLLRSAGLLLPADAAAPPGRISLSGELSWRSQPRLARVYIAAVIAAGAAIFALAFPLSFPQPVLFAVLVAAACLTSVWKVNLPLSLVSGSTLSVSYAANLAALLLLGPRHATVVAVAGTLTQCTVKVRQRYPVYRTTFSMAAEAITMAATGLAYVWTGGGGPPFDPSSLAGPLIAAIGTYFIVAGTAGAAAAVVVSRGGHWVAVLMLAPVYLTYRTYRIFVGRLEDQRRHILETDRLHQQAVEALAQARAAEHALATEKERLAAALAEMTRLEEARQELLEREQAARAGAEETNRLKDQFLAIVSHELRTPLNAVLGWADLLRGGKLDESSRRRAFDAIFGSARRQKQLIDELLDLARIRSGKLQLDRVAVSLPEVVRGAVDMVQPEAEAKHVRIHLAIEDPSATVLGDSTRLQQIVCNLLSNAIKFGPNDGTIEVALRRTGADVEIVVADSGPGISPGFLPFVFEPFQQEDGSTTRLHGGLGLGLSIVKQLVQLHDGRVTVASGRPGAVFTVSLSAVEPPTLAAGDGAAAAAEEHGAREHALDSLVVLVVDDDPDSREVLAAHLESRRAVVLTAASAAEALEILQRNDVDVLLADLAMPGEDGYSLIRRVRETRRTASLPAAALTAFAREEDRQRALGAGFQLHLSKPIDAKSLVDAVTTLAAGVGTAAQPLRTS